jgi:glutamate-5-semialdehyde dehydrogenase
MQALKSYAEEKVERARKVLRLLSSIPTEVKNRTLLRAAELLDKRREYIKEENKKDIAFGESQGLSSALLDRLLLNDKRIDGMIKVLRDVASLAGPSGRDHTHVATSQRAKGRKDEGAFGSDLHRL